MIRLTDKLTWERSEYGTSCLLLDGEWVGVKVEEYDINSLSGDDLGETYDLLIRGIKDEDKAKEVAEAAWKMVNKDA